MTLAPDAAATPAEITLGGRKLRMSPLTRADRAEFDRWLQQEVIAAARAGLSADMPAEERREWMDAAIRQAQRTSMQTRDGMEKITTQEGIARLLWLGLRHNHPDLLPESVADLLDAAAIEASMEVWELINVPKGNRGKVEGEPPTVPQSQ